MSPRLLATAAALAVLAACAPGASRAPAAAPAPAPPPVTTPTVAPDTVETGPALEEKALRDAPDALLGSARYDLPMESNTWVATELDFLVNQRKAVVGRWMQRAEFYQDFVKGVFAGYGLPTDLHHLAMVESGYLPTARSHAGAVGMWQFMSATGRGMGLRIDDAVDERMDPVRSTHAAARHLRDLNRQFGGDWSLAAAAYNAGHGRISRGLQGAGARDFWELAVRGTLAQETKQYVPRLYAVTIIARDPARFGFARVGAVTQTFAYDSIRTAYALPLSELAAMAGLPASALTGLNPHLYRGTTPDGPYWVWAPKGSGQALQTAYLASDFHRDGGYGSYAVRRGDSVDRLATFAGLTIGRIRELNPRVDVEKLPAGTRLRLPRTAASVLAARPVERLAARQDDAEKKDEERPSRRARAASRATGENDGGEEPRRSETSSRRPARSASRSASSERPERETPAKKESESTSSRSRARFDEHEVRDGETLWRLAREYGVEVEEIREANDLDGNTIVPGRTLRIPRKAGERPTSSSGTARVAGRAAEDKDDAPSSSRREREGASSSTARSASRSTETPSPRRPTAEVRKAAEAPRGSRFASHVVKSGETLWGIARRYDSTVVAIREANEMDDESLKPGQKLRIPRAED
ncbi:MAG TPA: LysM peptidoglycan-binding domain-containing protein [Longimicrobiaceae bacterium]